MQNFANKFESKLKIEIQDEAIKTNIITRSLSQNDDYSNPDSLHTQNTFKSSVNDTATVTTEGGYKPQFAGPHLSV